jgi:hypothetical protein
MKIVGEFVENSGATDFLLFCEDEFVGPLELACGDARVGFDHDGNLDRTGGADAFVGVECVGFAGVEVFSEEADFAFERVDEVFYLIVNPFKPCLGLCSDS